MLAHLSTDVRKDLVAVGEFNPEHRVRERLDDGALDLYGTLFLGHGSFRALTGSRIGISGIGVVTPPSHRTSRGA